MNYIIGKNVTPLLVAWVLVGVAHADPPKVTDVLVGLDNPAGVAVQPQTGQVFVSESAAGRIVRVQGATHEDVVTGFPKDSYGPGSYEEQTRFDIGPLGLAFVDRNTLVVGGGGLSDGAELLRVYQVPDAGNSIKAETMKASLGPIKPGNLSAKGEGNFYGVAVSANAIFVTCNGDDTKGWISRAEIKNGKFGELTPIISTKQATGINAPVGVTIGPSYLAVGQMGEISVPHDSLLTFYDVGSRTLLSQFATGLHDIVGLAYCPTSGRLYAIDFGWGENQKDGGLFRLDSHLEAGRQTVKAVKIAALDKPTALAFGPKNTLYVTLFGTAAKDADEKPGKLVKIVGDL